MNTSNPALQAILQLADAEGATQQLAIEIISQPRGQRDRLIRRLRALYCDGIESSGQAPQTAGRMGDLLEARLRDQVAHIEARGGGTVGTA
jgi:hypothetical protein